MNAKSKSEQLPDESGELVEGEKNGVDEFQRMAAEKPQSIWSEFIDFLWTDKKWWLMPIVFVLLVISVFVVLTNSVVGPFIYVLF